MWTVSASGTPAEVKTALATQFAEPPAGLPVPSQSSSSIESNMMVYAARVISAALSVYDADRTVTVTATGTMFYDDWAENSGGRQNVSINVVDGGA